MAGRPGDPPLSPDVSPSAEVNPFKSEVERRYAALPAEARQRPIGRVRGTAYFRVEQGVHSGGVSVDLEELLALPEESLARSLAGLAHPVRIKLYRALLSRLQHGQDSATLLDAAGLNTTGQLYHHLREMEDVGLVVRRGRNLWAAENLFWVSLAMTAAQGLMKWRGESAPQAPPKATAVRKRA